MANGSTTINFGAWPGTARATADVSGQTGYVAGSRVEAFILPVATADHSLDEHRSVMLKVLAFYKVYGTFTIEGYENAPYSVMDNKKQYRKQFLHGQYTVGWAWSN